MAKLIWDGKTSDVIEAKLHKVADSKNLVYQEGTNGCSLETSLASSLILPLWKLKGVLLFYSLSS